MPIARVAIMEGRTEEQIAEVIRAVTEALHQSLDAPYENIRVLVEQVPRTQWGIGGKTAKALGRK